MPTSFRAAEASTLTRQFKLLVIHHDDALKMAQAYPTQVVRAAQNQAAQRAVSRLREIPIDDIRDRIPRLRTKTLNDYGYRTLADVYAATSSNLASVKGISESTAVAMKRAAEVYVKDLRADGKVRLSADDVNPASTELVTAISRYLSSQEAILEAKDADDRHAHMLADRAAATLTSYESRLSCLLAFGEKKQSAEEAFRSLGELVDGAYGSGLIRSTEVLNKTDSVAPEAAWDEFRTNPIRFMNALEALAPDLVGSDDASFGLTEELAREVQDECFFPDGLRCDLRRYQEWGVKYILHQGKVLLGDEMGLGKTIQAIAAMVSLKNTGATHFMVVCPASVLTNWTREVSERSLLRVSELYGATRQAHVNSWANSGGVAITTYETLSRITVPESVPLGLLVVDEAHYIKNSQTKRSVAVRKMCTRTQRLLFMTGTPLENNVDEMVSLVQALRPNIAAQLQALNSTPFAPRFRKTIAPVYYRRKRGDVLSELPDLIESREWCTMGSEETRIYESDALSKSYMAARRVSWNVSDRSESSKATRLVELVEEAQREGRKVLVFSYFLDTLRFVRSVLGEQALGPITGAVPPQSRQDIIDDFDKKDAGTVLISQIQAGGTGLNIQSASVVILCEPQLKPSIESQAIARAYRMGQSRNVLVYRLLCTNSIDERISELLDKKQRIFDAFADKSDAAAQTVEIDSKTLGGLIEDEIERINKEHAEKSEGSQAEGASNEPVAAHLRGTSRVSR